MGVNSLKNRILSDMVWMIIMILMISLSGIVSIQILRNSSYKIADEYYEMKSIHELTPLLQELVYPANNYIVYHRHADLVMFKYKSLEFQNTLEQDKNVIPEVHEPLLDRIIKNTGEINALVMAFEQKLKQQANPPVQLTLKQLNELFNVMNADINVLLDETQEEIEHAIGINKKAIKHSTLLIIVLTFLVSIGGVVWSYRFIRQITGPVEKLIQFTRRVSKGDFSTRLDTVFDQELNNLAISLNKMTEDLNNTTVKRNYFDNIINSISDAIFVTNEQGKIQLTNRIVEEKLGYKREEILQKNIIELLQIEDKPGHQKNIDGLHELLQCCSEPGKTIYMKTNRAESIPVLIANSILKSERSTMGAVFVAHDISENLRIERQIAREKRMRQQLINEAQENERLRIATELHDGLGHMLTALQYFIENKLRNKKHDEHSFTSALEELQNKLDQVVIETKNISHDLVPMLLKDFGLEVALKKIIDDLNSKDTGICFNFSAFNFEGRLPAGLEKAIFRLAQEGINNIVKHSGAENAFIQLIKHDHSIVLLIDDDGKGFDWQNILSVPGAAGIGLMSMRERVETLNGTLSISSSNENGTEILIEIPIENENG